MATASNVHEKYGIQQFDGKNFDHWKFRMEIILDNYDVKKCIEAEVEQPSTDFVKLDKKCKSIIVQCIANSHLEYIKDKQTAYQMWMALDKVFQRKGIARQLYLRKKLLTMKLGKDDTLELHFLKFEEVVRELRSVGAKLEEIDVVCHLLLTLPKTYDSMVTALETLEPEKLTLGFVKGKLLDHEMKKKNAEIEDVPRTAAFNSSVGVNKKVWKKKPSLIKCHKCGKIGHLRKQCWSKTQVNQASSEESSSIAFIAAVAAMESGIVSFSE